MKNKKIWIYRILLIILIISAIIIGGIIFSKRQEDYKYDKENKEIVKLFHQEENSKNDKKNEKENKSKKIDLEYKGQKVIGLIEIPAIDLEYPILSKTTKLAMLTSISRFYGGEINEYGNVSLAGHNNYTGTMFGKNKNLKLKDKIKLTDLTGKTVEYEIFDIFVTDPDDTTILETKDKTIREVTLITCKNGRKERLIVKAKEVEKT